MSWFTDWLHKVTAPKVQAEVVCQRLVTKQVVVAGEGGTAEIVSAKGAVRIYLTNPDKFKNHIAVILKDTGECSVNLVGPDNNIRRQIAINGQGEVLS